MQNDEYLFELENLLNEAKQKFTYGNWKICRSFPKYEVDIYGHVKSPAKVVERNRPRNMKEKGYYFIKEKILRHLHTGIEQRWTTVIILDKNENRRQISVAKLMASTFLDIDIEKLPRQIYFIDGNPKNLTLNNLSFFRTR